MCWDVQALQQYRHRRIAQHVTTQWLVCVYLILVVPADTCTRDIAGVVEVTDETLSCAFGDANDLRDFARGARRLASDVHQYTRLIGQKQPVVYGHRTPRSYLPAFGSRRGHTDDLDLDCYVLTQTLYHES